MASEEHTGILADGVDAWNEWRLRNRMIRPDLRGANLEGQDLQFAKLSDTDLKDANLAGANLQGARLGDSYLRRANLCDANLALANLSGANLRHADLTGASLIHASLRRADLSKATLNRADLTGAVLDYARLVETRLDGAKLVRCSVYGVSAWNLDLRATVQSDLVITGHGEPKVTGDNLEVAQFIYLLLYNERIRHVIDTIGEKAVLILGRFTDDRKPVLDGIRAKLRELGFVPILFDFDRPTQRDFTETIKTLAGLSRFIVADITNPRSSPLELQAIVPDYMVPLVPIIHEGEEPFEMFRDLKQKHGRWVMDVLAYDSAGNLLTVLEKAVVQPALRLADELALEKAQAMLIRHVRDYTSDRT